MSEKWIELKRKFPEALLLYRVGDFYEAFHSDAIALAHVCGLTLTKRLNGTSPLAGFPHFVLDQYLPKLAKAGLRIAICDELKDPKGGEQ